VNRFDDTIDHNYNYWIILKIVTGIELLTLVKGPIMKSHRRLICLLLGMLIALFCFSCGESPYAGLTQKAAQVDSLVIKGRALGLANIDSLRQARIALAKKYIAGLELSKITQADEWPAAKLFIAAGKLDTAMTMLEKLETNDARDQLFDLYLQKGKVDQAAQLFDQHLKASAGDQIGMYYEGLFYGYQEVGRNTEAMKITETAIASLPPAESVSFSLEKAALLYEDGKKNEALALLQELKKSYKDDPRALRGIEAKWNLFNLIGRPAPELKIAQWIDGKPVSMKDLRGKVVFLDFWAPWCGPCRAMFPHMKKLYAEFHDKGLEIIGVTRYQGFFNQLGQNLKNLAPEAELEWIRKFKAHHEMPIVYAVASMDEGRKNEATYGVYGIPHMVLIDKKGIVRLYTIGSGKSSEDKLQKGVEELLAE